MMTLSLLGEPRCPTSRPTAPLLPLPNPQARLSPMEAKGVWLVVWVVEVGAVMKAGMVNGCVGDDLRVSCLGTFKVPGLSLIIREERQKF